MCVCMCLKTCIADFWSVAEVLLWPVLLWSSQWCQIPAPGTVFNAWGSSSYSLAVCVCFPGCSPAVAGPCGVWLDGHGRVGLHRALSPPLPLESRLNIPDSSEDERLITSPYPALSKWWCYTQLLLPEGSRECSRIPAQRTVCACNDLSRLLGIKHWGHSWNKELQSRETGVL